MPRPRMAGLLALALLALTFAPANAGSSGVLRLTGRFTGYTDITLTRPTTFDGRSATMAVRGGSYVAWWVTRIGERPGSRSNQDGGLRWVGHDPDRDRRSTPFTSRTEPLPPGRYRVYLATDGTATVTIPATGLAGTVSLSPRFRTAGGARTSTFTVTAGLVNGEFRSPLSLPPDALVVSSTLVMADPGATVQSLTACVTAPAAECGGPTSATGYTSSLDQGHGVQFTAVYDPGTVRAGPAEAVQRAKAGPGVTSAHGSYFFLVPVL